MDLSSAGGSAYGGSPGFQRRSMGQAKTSGVWIALALVLGVAFFGIYKSMELLKQNTALSQSLNDVKVELAGTEIALSQTKDLLRRSDARNVELIKDVETATTKLSKIEEGFFVYQKRLDRLSNKLKVATKTNTALGIKNIETLDRLMRAEFENSEMKKTLSSVVELKRAIRELKKKPSKEKSLAPSGKPFIWFWNVPPVKAAEKPLEGNKGFFVKDGESTFKKVVTINVLPEEPTAQ